MSRYGYEGEKKKAVAMKLQRLYIERCDRKVSNERVSYEALFF